MGSAFTRLYQSRSPVQKLGHWIKFGHGKSLFGSHLCFLKEKKKLTFLAIVIQFFVRPRCFSLQVAWKLGHPAIVIILIVNSTRHKIPQPHHAPKSAGSASTTVQHPCFGMQLPQSPKHKQHLQPCVKFPPLHVWGVVLIGLRCVSGLAAMQLIAVVDRS